MNSLFSSKSTDENFISLCIDIANLLEETRMATVSAVDTITRWELSGQMFTPFIWKGVRYLNYINSDLQFICDSPNLVC